MLLTEDKSDDKYQIKAYEPGKITVNDKCYNHSLIISPQQLLAWEPRSLNEIKPQHWQSIIELKPSIVLLGTGATFKPLEKQTLESLLAANIGVEHMDTGAACRTFVALAAEGRAVIAALLIS